MCGQVWRLGPGLYLGPGLHLAQVPQLSKGSPTSRRKPVLSGTACALHDLDACHVPLCPAVPFLLKQHDAITNWAVFHALPCHTCPLQPDAVTKLGGVQALPRH